MITRSQLITLTAMATLGGSFAGFLAVGIAVGDITLAIINLCVIIALFGVLFTVSSEKPKNHIRAGDVHVGGELHEDFKNS